MMLLAITFVLTLHLICVNLASAGPLVGIGIQIAKPQSPAWNLIGGRLAWLSVGALLLGMTLGAVILLVYWFDSESTYIATLGRMSARDLGFAGAELVFSLVLLVVYALLWSRRRGRGWLLMLLPLLAATNLLYHFPPLMIAISNLADRPDLVIEDQLTRQDLLSVIRRPEVLSLTLHFAFASIAVAGMTLVWLGSRPSNDGENESVVQWGARIALVPTLLQLFVGIWVLTAVRPPMRDALLGNDGVGTTLFVASLVAVFGFLHVLVSMALGEISNKQIRRSWLLLFLIIACMVGSLLRSRQVLRATRPVVISHPQQCGPLVEVSATKNLLPQLRQQV